MSGAPIGHRMADLPAPPFPGATLVLDGDGQIMRAWLGPASPIAVAAGDAFAALDLDEGSPDAARMQLLLASACNANAAAWPVLSPDAPAVLPRRDGSALVVQWQPIVAEGRVAAVAAFIVAAEPAPRAEDDDPTERNRICVEALGLLDECDACVRHLRTEPGARHAVHRLFRAIHTIKGTARGAQRAVFDLAHHTEETLDILRARDGDVTAAALAELEADLRRLRAAVAAARPRGEIDDAIAELSPELRPAVADLRAAVAGLRESRRDAIALGRRVVERIADGADRAKLRGLMTQCTASRNALLMLEEATEPDAELAAEVAALAAHVELYLEVYREVTASDAGPSTLVSVASWMDAPSDRSGSFHDVVEVLARAGVPSLVAAFALDDPYALRRALAALADAAAMFEPARPRDDASLRFERAQRDLLAALDGLARDLPPARLADARAIVQRLVWTPLSVIARRLPRMTRTLGADLGKHLAAEIDLGDLLVAPEIGRVIGEILVHAVRNAADHGIEAPAERAAAGKDPTGTIRVVAQGEIDRVIVKVSDDGRGVAIERVRASAIARGLIARASAAALSDAEVIELLFMPGFSTAPMVTAVSGRGVGMDVIKSLVEEQGGHVALTSEAGRGTTLVIELPYAPI